MGSERCTDVQPQDKGDSIVGCCHWDNLPDEILIKVLIRVEESSMMWPYRRNVVACAGVCRNWRQITKDIVKDTAPQFLVYPLTFPISVKQPGPRYPFTRCYIRRCSTMTSVKYYLFLISSSLAPTGDGKFLLAARRFRRPKITQREYIISLQADDMSRGSNAYVGEVRSNFLGTKYTVFDGHPPPALAKMTESPSSRLVNSKQLSPKVPTRNYPVVHISRVYGPNGTKIMQCIMDTIPSSAIEPGGEAPTQTEFPLRSKNFLPSLPYLQSKSNRLENSLSGPLANQKDEAHALVLNKVPARDMDFNDRRRGSFRNFRLVPPGEDRIWDVILRFEKLKKDEFEMDYRYPISAFQAFAICLSSFDTLIVSANDFY